MITSSQLRNIRDVTVADERGLPRWYTCTSERGMWYARSFFNVYEHDKDPVTQSRLRLVMSDCNYWS